MLSPLCSECQCVFWVQGGNEKALAINLSSYILSPSKNRTPREWEAGLLSNGEDQKRCVVRVPEQRTGWRSAVGVGAGGSSEKDVAACYGLGLGEV